MSHAYTRCCDGNHGRVTLFLVVVMIVVVDVSATLVIIVIMIVVSLMTISVVGVVFTAAFVSSVSLHLRRIVLKQLFANVIMCSMLKQYFFRIFFVVK